MSKTTEFGFDFGSMEVTRVCGDEDAAHVISIKTPKKHFHMRATKSGILSFYDKNGDKLYLTKWNK